MDAVSDSKIVRGKGLLRWGDRVRHFTSIVLETLMKVLNSAMKLRMSLEESFGGYLGFKSFVVGSFSILTCMSYMLWNSCSMPVSL